MGDVIKSISCRICLEDDEHNYSNKCLSLFEYYGDCVIADKVNAIANVGIKKDDGLPDQICPSCLLQLENAVAFKKKCEASNDILHNRTIHSYKSKELEYNEIEIKEELETDIFDAATYDLDDIKLDNDVLNDAALKPDNTVPVECDDCGGTFKSKCKLRVHWKKMHLPDKLVCPKCIRLFKSFKALNSHIKRNPRSCLAASKANIEGKGRSRVYHCPHCEYITKNSNNMDVHIAIHTGEKRLQCDKCPQVFIQYTSLYDHKENFHNEYFTVNTCQYCGKLIKGRRKWYCHLKMHKESTISCEVCKKVLKTRKSFQEHMKRHSGIKAYTCAMCSEAFYTASDLICHRLKVHIKKKFNCDICGYSLKTITALKRHKSKHTPTNTVCLTCGTFVEDADKLVLHQKIHTERNYHCPLCEKTFFKAKSRAKHVQKKHGSSMSELNGKVNKKSGRVQHTSCEKIEHPTPGTKESPN